MLIFSVTNTNFIGAHTISIPKRYQKNIYTRTTSFKEKAGGPCRKMFLSQGPDNNFFFIQAVRDSNMIYSVSYSFEIDVLILTLIHFKKTLISILSTVRTKDTSYFPL